MPKQTIALSLMLLINATQLAAGVWRTSPAVNLQGDETAAIEIAEKHRAAIGSPAAEKITTIEEQREVQVLGQTNQVTRLTDRPSRRFYSKQVSANGTTEMGFDGKRVWQKTPFFRGYLSPSDPAAKRILQGGNESPLLSYKTTGRKIFRLPNETIEGKEYLIVTTTTLDLGDREIPVKFHIDPVTYFVNRVERGAAVKQITVFGDYRKVDGVWTSFTQTTITPNATIVSRITSIKHNVPIDPARFEYSGEADKPAPASTPEATEKSPQPPDDKSSEAISESQRIETFEFAWSKINDTYWDRKFNGIDWKGIHDKYLPIIKTTSSSTEFHRLLDRMVQELHLSHFRVIPPESVMGLNTRLGERHNGSIGADLRWLDGQLVVVDLPKDYPASVAGIRKGFVVTKINGQTPDQIFLKSKEESRYHPQETLARVRAVNQELNGPIGRPVNLEVLDLKNKPIELVVSRRTAPLESPLDFAVERHGDVGYIRFNVFLGDLLARFRAALTELKDTQGLIIDLRGNPGGAGDLAPALADMLSDGPGSLGSLRFRYSTRPYSYKGSGAEAYKGMVVLLVDEHTGSTAEVFSGGLQENGRAKVVGTRTAGAVLPSLAAQLPTGGALVHVISDFRTPKGIELEGRGVQPDTEAKLSRASILAGRDSVRERAVQVILTEVKNREKAQNRER